MNEFIRNANALIIDDRFTMGGTVYRVCESIPSGPHMTVLRFHPVGNEPLDGHCVLTLPNNIPFLIHPKQ